MVTPIHPPPPPSRRHLGPFTTDWKNATSRFEEEAKSSKITAEEWKQKSDVERVRHREAVAKYSEVGKAQDALKLQLEKIQRHADPLATEVESLKKSD